MKKGQMVFEFIIAAVLFFAVVIYTINYLNSAVTFYSSNFHSNVLHTKAMQVSELLLRNPGVWAAGTPSVLGLASGSLDWPALDSVKIQNLETYCEENYIELLDIIGFYPKNKVMIMINETGPDATINLLDCRPTTGVPEDITLAHIKRFAVLEDKSSLSVDVWVW